jgi:hypothetical protein
MEPELSRKAARIVHTDYFLSLDYNARLDFVNDVGKARNFLDITIEHQKIWKKAEEEIKHREAKRVGSVYPKNANGSFETVF